MADVFLSYKREDQPIARAVANDLEAEGFSVFFDVSIEVGDSWDATIERELAAARAVVVLWSPRSRESKWVRREAREGTARHILCPAMVVNCKVPLEFSDVQTASLVGRRSGDRLHAEWRRLCEAISRCVGKKARGATTLAATPPSTDPVGDAIKWGHGIASGLTAQAQGPSPQGLPPVKQHVRKPWVVGLAVAGLAAGVLIVGSLLRTPATSGAPPVTSLRESESHPQTAEPAGITQPQQATTLNTSTRLALGDIIGTWRCDQSSDDFQFIRFTPLGDDIIYWYSDTVDHWENTATEYVRVNPSNHAVWGPFNMSDYTVKGGRIELVQNHIENLTRPCTSYSRVP